MNVSHSHLKVVHFRNLWIITLLSAYDYSVDFECMVMLRVMLRNMILKGASSEEGWANFFKVWLKFAHAVSRFPWFSRILQYLHSRFYVTSDRPMTLRGPIRRSALSLSSFIFPRCNIAYATCAYVTTPKLERREFTVVRKGVLKSTQEKTHSPFPWL